MDAALSCQNPHIQIKRHASYLHNTYWKWGGPAQCLHLPACSQRSGSANHRPLLSAGCVETMRRSHTGVCEIYAKHSTYFIRTIHDCGQLVFPTQALELSGDSLDHYTWNIVSGAFFITTGRQRYRELGYSALFRIYHGATDSIRIWGDSA